MSARICVCVRAFMRALACFCTYLCARLFLLSCMREHKFREYKIATYHTGLDRHCHTMLGKEDKEFVIYKNGKMLSLSPSVFCLLNFYLFTSLRISLSVFNAFFYIAFNCMSRKTCLFTRNISSIGKVNQKNKISGGKRYFCWRYSIRKNFKDYLPHRLLSQNARGHSHLEQAAPNLKSKSKPSVDL